MTAKKTKTWIPAFAGKHGGRNYPRGVFSDFSICSWA
jgi:hypothetical protein